MGKDKNRSDQVNAFMDQLEHPLKAEVQALRAIIKGAHPGITEQVKWNAPSFRYRDYLATHNPWARQHAHLAFCNPLNSRAASDLLEGDYKDRRMAYFADMDAVRRQQAELERIIQILVRLMDEQRPS
jgi:hypothetical protein